MNPPERIYFNGAMLPYADATIHVSSVAARYGANVSEGLCAYAGDGGQSFVFRLPDHLERLRHSVRMMQIDCNYTDQDYVDAILVSLQENHIRGDAHLRLTVFITGDRLCDGRGPVSLVCGARARQPRPLDDRIVHAAIGSWRRIDDAMTPPRLKAGANCHSGRFGVLETRRNGGDQEIVLTLAGKVAEGANACFFMIRNGTLVTPPVTASILESVTRSTLIELAAAELRLPVEERDIDRRELYIADEAFSCGSGQELRPVLSIDRLPIGDARVGPITRHLWHAYQEVSRGRNPARFNWLTPVWVQPITDVGAGDRGLAAGTSFSHSPASDPIPGQATQPALGPS